MQRFQASAPPPPLMHIPEVVNGHAATPEMTAHSLPLPYMSGMPPPPPQMNWPGAMYSPYAHHYDNTHLQPLPPQVLASPPSGAVAPVTNYSLPSMSSYLPHNPPTNHLPPLTAPSSVGAANFYSDMPPLQLMQSLMTSADLKTPVTSSSNDTFADAGSYEYAMQQQKPSEQQQQPQQQVRVPLPPFSNLSPLKAVKVEQISPPLPPSTASYTTFAPGGACASEAAQTVTSMWNNVSVAEGQVFSVPVTSQEMVNSALGLNGTTTNGVAHENVTELASESQPTLASL